MNDKQTLLFVTGASRSGTTMLSRVLAAHDQILGMNELHYFGEIWDPNDLRPLNLEQRIRLAEWILARQARGIWGKGPSQSERAQARKLVETMPETTNGMMVYARVVRSLAAQSGKSMPCEQTPRNILYANRLLEIDPHTKFIQMIRDPRAVIASQKNRWRRKHLGGGGIPRSEAIRTWFNYHPLTMTELWLRAAKVGERLVGHPRFMQLRFEDLVESPADSIAALSAFVEVEYQSAMLNVPIVGSSQRRDEGDRGFSKDSIDSWRRVLNPSEIWLIERVAAPMMRRHGYNLLQPNPGLGLLAVLLRYPVHLAGVVLTNPLRAWVQTRALFSATKRGGS